MKMLILMLVSIILGKDDIFINIFNIKIFFVIHLAKLYNKNY
jgi:hypothetical protein